MECWAQMVRSPHAADEAELHTGTMEGLCRTGHVLRDAAGYPSRLDPGYAPADDLPAARRTRRRLDGADPGRPGALDRRSEASCAVAGRYRPRAGAGQRDPALHRRIQ